MAVNGTTVTGCGLGKAHGKSSVRQVHSPLVESKYLGLTGGHPER